MSYLILNTNDYNRDELLRILYLPLKETYTLDELRDAAREKLQIIVGSKDLDVDKDTIFNFYKDAFIKVASLLDINVPQYIRNELETIREGLLPKMKENVIFKQNNSFVVKHDDGPSVRTFPTPFVSGTINPLKKITYHKVVNINSCFRQQMAPSIFSTYAKGLKKKKNGKGCPPCNPKHTYSSSNFIVYLPEKQNKVVSMKLSSMEVPNTIYTISADMQTNVFQVVIEKDGTKVIVELPEGNYTATQLVTVINNILTAMYLKCIDIHIYAAYDEISGRFYFYESYHNYDFGLDFNIPNCSNRDIKLNLGWILGFRDAVYFSGDYIPKDDIWNYNTSDSHSPWACRRYDDCSGVNLEDISANLWNGPEAWPHGFIAEGMLDLSKPKYLFLVVNDYNNNVNNKYSSLVMDNTDINVSNILAKISMPYGKYEIGYDDSSDFIPKTREYFGPVSVEKLHIQVVDELGRIVNFNNNDISILLDFECLYNL